MSDPTFTSPPPAPIRGDASTFSARFAAFLTWMATFVAEMITAVPWFSAKAAQVAEDASDIAAAALVASNAAGLLGASITSVDATAGVKAITLTAARPSLVELNRRVVLVLKSDPTVKRFGTITSVTDSSHFDLTITSGGIFGAGTFSNWHVLDAAFLGSAATAAEIWEGATDAAAVTPKGLADAEIPAVLTDAPTVAWDVKAQGPNAEVTITANRTIGQPSNLKDGDILVLDIIENGTGGWTPSFHSIWEFRNTPSFNTAAGKRHTVVGRYRASHCKLRSTFYRPA